MKKYLLFYGVCAALGSINALFFLKIGDWLFEDGWKASVADWFFSIQSDYGTFVFFIPLCALIALIMCMFFKFYLYKNKVNILLPVVLILSGTLVGCIVSIVFTSSVLIWMMYQFSLQDIPH